MRTSRFTVLVPDFPETGEHVLYSTLRDEYVGLDDVGRRTLGKLRDGAVLDEEEVDVAQSLMELGYVVRDRAHDEQNLKENFQLMTNVDGDVRVVLMPTSKCNLACTYCFQNANPSGVAATHDVMEETIAWVLRRVAETSSPGLRIVYFGGEPLLKKDYVRTTAARFHAALKAMGKNFSFQIITNGVFLDRELVLELKPLGLDLIKITLEGDKETHDVVRIGHKGQPTFDGIYAKVRELADLTRLYISGNFAGAHEEKSFVSLLERMAKDGLTDKLARVGFKPRLDTFGAGDAKSCNGCSKSEADPALQGRMQMSLENSGFNINKPTDGGPCELHWKKAWTVDPEGNVYKCPGVAGYKDLAIGNVMDESHGEVRRRDPLAGQMPYRLCGDCAFLPKCYGGCMASIFMRTGMTNEVNCEKRYFETVMMEAVKRRYLEEFYPERMQKAPQPRFKILAA